MSERGNQIRIETLIYGTPFIGFIDYIFESENTVYIIDLKTKDKFLLIPSDKEEFLKERQMIKLKRKICVLNIRSDKNSDLRNANINKFDKSINFLIIILQEVMIMVY